MASTSPVHPPRAAHPAARPPEAAAHRPGTGAARALGLALWALAAGLVAVALAGPVGAGLVDYRITRTVESQLIGLDIVSVALVAPLAAVAGVLVVRRHPLGPLLGIGPAAYAAYMVPQYVLGPDYLALEGDNERLFPLLLAVLVLGLVAAVACWAAADPGRLPASARAEQIVGRILLPVAALLVFGRYPAALADWMSARPEDTGYLAGPGFAWTIALLDLGVALPATVAVWVGLRSGAAWARRGLYALVAWLALVGVAVAGMATAMYARDDPAMSGVQLGMMVGLGALVAALAVVLFAPLLRRPGPGAAD
jgi:hypothetical protein